MRKREKLGGQFYFIGKVCAHRARLCFCALSQKMKSHSIHQINILILSPNMNENEKRTGQKERKMGSLQFALLSKCSANTVRFKWPNIHEYACLICSVVLWTNARARTLTWLPNSVLYLKCTNIYCWVKQTHTCYTQHRMHTVWLNGQLINLCMQKKKIIFRSFRKKGSHFIWRFEREGGRERECIDFWLAS